MVDSGMVVVDTGERQQHLGKVPLKRGRPRIHPVKEKKPGSKRGRPRIHTVKIKIPGRKRGRPSKPKVEGVPPKVKGPRGRPRKVGSEATLKVVFSFEDKYDLSPEEMRKLKMEGAKLPDVIKKRRGRKRKVDSNPGDAAAKCQEPKKRGRKKKVQGEAAEEKIPKKRGPKPKVQQSLVLPGGWCVTKRPRNYRSKTAAAQIGMEMVETEPRNAAQLPSASNAIESPDEWAMNFWQTLLLAHYRMLV